MRIKAVARLFIICFAFFIEVLGGPKKVVGYYPAWNRYTFTADKIEFAFLTHITHAFIWPQADGSLDKYSTIPYPDLVDRTHQAGKKILISVGGWGNCTDFSAVLADSTKRQYLIDNLVAFCDDNGYDGIDLDWEYPGSSDKNNLTGFVIALDQALKADDSTRIVTMAVPAGAWSGQYFDFQGMAPYVEWFGCMTYDFHGTWTNHAGHNAPLYAPPNETEGSAHDAIQYLKSRGLPGDKILMGIPFYGRQFNTTGLYQSSTGGDALSYNEIITMVDNGWTYHWDSVALVPYLTNTANSQLITFDDTVSVGKKSEYVLNQGLAGVKVWHLGQDLTGGEQPLLSVLANRLLAESSLLEEFLPGEYLPDQIVINRAYPNPFNDSVVIDYTISAPMNVKMELYNLLGQRMDCLMNCYQNGGNHTLHYRAEKLTSGFYLVVISNENGYCSVFRIEYLK